MGTNAATLCIGGNGRTGDEKKGKHQIYGYSIRQNPINSSTIAEESKEWKARTEWKLY